MARWKRNEILTVVVTAVIVTAALIAALQVGDGPQSVGAAPAATEEPPGVTDPAIGPVPGTGTGRDPLTPAELAGAHRLADVAGAEFLSAELAAGPARQAALYYYDYRTDELVKQVVNLTAGRLDNTYRATDMQPPPTPQEVTTAFTVLLGSPIGATFRSRWAGDIGSAFPGPAAATVTAQTYVADGSACGRHRCVQLLPRATATGDFVDISDIVVDLSDRTVRKLS
ncbi:hypothetical protein [Actinoplanes sp. N902-109]|uniref:hypothetical protein n=1 Tax=Actinoplanes sp. (strain N902-109) TaxID=649831 RepID=UPI0003AB4880|nr:hypothetical protein [Actinoplanes sp. N902-109]